MAAGLSASDLAWAARSSWAFFASAAALRRSAKLAFLDQFISVIYAQKTAPGLRDRRFQIGARHAISQGRTRPRLKSSRASRDGSLRRSSVRLSDGVTTFVERCRLRSADFPVALLLQSQNRTIELQSDWLGRLIATAPVDRMAGARDQIIPIQKS